MQNESHAWRRTTSPRLRHVRFFVVVCAPDQTPVAVTPPVREASTCRAPNRVHSDADNIQDDGRCAYAIKNNLHSTPKCSFSICLHRHRQRSMDSWRRRRVERYLRGCINFAKLIPRYSFDPSPSPPLLLLHPHPNPPVNCLSRMVRSWYRVSQTSVAVRSTKFRSLNLRDSAYVRTCTAGNVSNVQCSLRDNIQLDIQSLLARCVNLLDIKFGRHACSGFII